MKLLQKTNRYYLGFSVAIFLVAGIIIYILLSFIYRDEMNEKLNKMHAMVTEHIKKKEEVPDLYPVIEVDEVTHADTPMMKDTLIYDPLENEYEKYRENITYEKINGKTYRITLRLQQLENQPLMITIALSMLVLVFLLLVSLYYLNRYLSGKVWSSFFDNLAILKNFNLSGNEEPVQLRPSEISEFSELNRVIENMSVRIVNEYKSLKEFTENAAHELQTPLAVIISRLELLIQQPDLTERQARDLHTVFNAATRMAKLNENLLLLANIENDLYYETDIINIQERIDNQLELIGDFTRAKNIRIIKEYIPQPVMIRANTFLVDVLISNLLTNAVKHNINNGELYISITGTFLKINNTGREMEQAPEEMFNRFKKGRGSVLSHGLGLAIVKQIVINNQWKISYAYMDHHHIITVHFR